MDFSRAAEIPHPTVSTWYRGARVPDPESCDRIADALHVDVERWEAEDQRLGAEIAACDAALAALPAPPDAGQVRARVATLTSMRDALPTLMALDPVGARRALQAIGAQVIVRFDGVLIDWPASYASLLI